VSTNRTKLTKNCHQTALCSPTVAKSPLTYTGALALLGQHERPLLDKIDRLLGGAILASTPAAGPAAWALIEPKNEAIGIVRSLLDSAKNRALSTSGHTRRELLAAAHTVLVVSSFFDAVATELGPHYELLALTDNEKLRLVGTTDGLRRVSQLLELPVSLPSAARDFDANLTSLFSIFHNFGTATVDFISGLAVADRVLHGIDTGQLIQQIAQHADEDYQDAYLRFAVDVPEFAIWVAWNDNAALRSAQTEVKGLLARQSTALTKLHDLLVLTAPNREPGAGSYRELLANKARAVLTKPLLRTESERPSDNVTFPTVEQGFVTPHFKAAWYWADAQPTQEVWWSTRSRRTDLDEFLAAHLSSADSTSLPILILGHPGAGKSLLTEVLAARLPPTAFTVVRVPLRRVDPTKPVHEQISGGMGLNQRTDWGEFTRECHDTIRVVILDGFDELILATGVRQSAYLEQVARFQQDELDLGRPVAVIVTSRTLVADRARIPDGCPMIKLEEFDEDQVKTWLHAWNSANMSTIGFRPLEPEELLHHNELPRQPLILLILAIYAAELGDRLDSEDLSGAGLYQRMLDSFIRRQVREKSPRPLTEHEADEQARYKRWQLSMAAFGMFNRGFQHVTENELELDMAPFMPQGSAREQTTFDHQISRAEQTISDFFFVQVSEGDDRRAYEFLHSTFGEYLIAEHTVHCLTQLHSNDGFPVPEAPDDDRLFALLSHQPILKRVPIVEFAMELVGDQRQHVLDLLTDLLRLARSHARPRKFERYEPTRYDAVGRLATYTANLATLRILLADDEVSPRTLAPKDTDPMLWWRSLVNLWESGLDTEGWQDILSAFTLTYEQEPVLVTTPSRNPGNRARLLHKHAEELRILAGAKLFGPYTEIRSEAEKDLYLKFVDLSLSMAATFPLTRLLPASEERFEWIINGISSGLLGGLTLSALWQTLSHTAPQLPFEMVGTLVSLALTGGNSEYGKPWSGNECELAAVVAAHPGLLLTNNHVATIAQDPGFPLSTTALPIAVVLLWRAEQTCQEHELSALRALRLKFDERVASDPRGLSDAWMAPEYLTYLRMNRPGYWNINDKVLKMASVQTSVLRRTAPQDASYLVTAYRGSNMALLLEFAQEYLAAQGQPVNGVDVYNVVERLAAYAELPWSRP
jgi:hypothetical protein